MVDLSIKLSIMVAWLVARDRALVARKEVGIRFPREAGGMSSGIGKLLCNTFDRTIGRFSRAMAWL
jgi:hypothetical protein